MPMHSLKSPLVYTVEHMKTVIVDHAKMTAGFVGHVILDKEGKTLLDPADDYNVTRYLAAPDAAIIGRGVLVEQIWVDEWVVAWRPYSAKPEVIQWTE